MAQETVLEGPPVLTEKDVAAIQEQIERDWNADAATSEACNRPVELRIHLTPGGKVTKVENIPGEVETPACAAYAESGRQAVMKASPLKLPEGANFPTIRLRFLPFAAEE